MNTKETNANPTRAAGPASVFIGDTTDTSSGSVALTGFEKGEALTANPYYRGGELASAEAQTAPVAVGMESPTDAAWRIISEWNLEKGYVSAESLLRLSRVLHPEVIQ